MRSASVVGALESTGLLDLCTGLEAHLLQEGVRSTSAQAMLLAMESGAAVAHFGDLFSDFFSARLLSNELARRPAMVRYMPSMQLLVFNCPGDDNSAFESIIFSESAPKATPRS